jgi:putative ABC transport system substrate-binding protein
VKLLIPVGTTASMAVKRQAPTTPILFISVGNPLGIGLVKNLGHPGLNVTGFSDNLAELSSKYVQFASELGSPSGVHYLWYPGWTDGQYRLQATEQAAQSLKVKLRTYALNDIVEVDKAMAAVKRNPAIFRSSSRRSSSSWSTSRRRRGSASQVID